MRPCNGTIPALCADCPDGTFSDVKNKKCQRCQRCRRKELIKRECTKSSNTACECRPGYIYHPTKPCFKCPDGLIARENKCVSATSSPKINESPPQGHKNSLIIGFTIAGIFVVIILVIVIFYFIYKRRAQRVPFRGNEIPDILRNHGTPPLPPKTTMNRQIENNYGPAPQVCHPLVEQKLISRHLPFSLVHDMNEMLSTHHTKNYKHLAGKLGYNHTFVKSLALKQQPLETLMDDYMSSENPTKEKLVEALKAIDRKDVAKMVMEEL